MSNHTVHTIYNSYILLYKVQKCDVTVVSDGVLPAVGGCAGDAGWTFGFPVGQYDCAVWRV